MFHTPTTWIVDARPRLTPWQRLACIGFYSKPHFRLIVSDFACAELPKTLVRTSSRMSRLEWSQIMFAEARATGADVYPPMPDVVED